jgi:hypothetical protein
LGEIGLVRTISQNKSADFHRRLALCANVAKLYNDAADMTHVYEVRPRKDKRGVDVISQALPFGRLWYDTPDHAVGYAIHSSRSHNAVISVYDATGNVIETHEHKGDFKEW